MCYNEFMRLCIFSGTFNPIHIAHLKMAEYVLKNFGFDKILFIASDEKLRLDRLMKRNNFTEEEALLRVEPKQLEDLLTDLSVEFLKNWTIGDTPDKVRSYDGRTLDEVSGCVLSDRFKYRRCFDTAVLGQLEPLIQAVIHFF